MTDKNRESKTEKDYIVVKDWKTAEGLIKNKIPSLKGKWIIVAPDGLELLPSSEILKLPQIQSEFQKLKEEVEGLFDPFRSSNQKDEYGNRIFGVPGFKVSAKDIHGDVLKLIERRIKE